MFTRKQYLNKEISHKEYYNQFSNDRILEYVIKSFPKKKLETLKEVYYNGNVHLSLVPNVPLSYWDSMEYVIKSLVDRNLLKEAGENSSLSTMVCIAKNTLMTYFDEVKKSER